MRAPLLQAAGGKVSADVSWGAVSLRALLVFVVSLTSIAFTRNQTLIATFWPSNAIVLAVALRSSPTLMTYARILAGAAIGIFLANLAGGNGPVLSLAFAAANIAEVAAAAALLLKLQADLDLTRIRSLSMFVVLAAFIAPVVGASIGAAFAAPAHAMTWPATWLSWFASDALGMIIVGPFLLSLDSASWRSWRDEKRHAEAFAIFTLLLAVVIVAAYYRAVLFIIIPVILVAIFRFRIAGAAIGTLLTAIVGTIFIIKGIGAPVISQSTPAERIMALQIFLAATALWSFPVAAALAERDRLMSELDVANSRLDAENKRKSQMVVGLHRRLVNVEEQERLRLSHELHDQTGQTLAAALLELSGIEKQIDGAAARGRLYELREQIEQIAQTVHRISWELRPAAINELGLASALANYASGWSAQFGIPVELHCDGGKLDALAEDIRMTLYRVVGEALTNVCKHARGATAVSIVINCEPSLLRVTVTDDGCGFDTKPMVENTAKSVNDGLGLVGMRERLALLGGELEIESSPGSGTTVYARIPTRAAAA
jgi:signal transduction histidine kinase